MRGFVGLRGWLCAAWARLADMSVGYGYKQGCMVGEARLRIPSNVIQRIFRGHNDIYR